ncbi:MAG: nucleotidyltransferase [Candidatus Saganbacteria bacterium]|nr:nucleotidyltransferase [Candidatus Saganbacteria bacterium]
MSEKLEEVFTNWSQGPSETEKDKCGNAESAIKKAISAHKELSAMDISVFAQGSYRARTNISQDSDVDICVCLNSIFFADYPAGKGDSDYLNKDGGISFPDYKNLIQKALIDYFGQENIRRGNKAFDVHANTYRVDADVIPAFRRRRYISGKTDGYVKPEGTAFKTDQGVLIENWPEQNYINGVSKNESTSMQYKKVVRVLKNLRNAMQEDKITAANDIASFLVECLAWNVPDEGYKKDTYCQIIRYVLAHLYNETLEKGGWSEWGEVNELKYLFRQSQPWTLKQAHDFLSEAWDYAGFK